MGLDDGRKILGYRPWVHKEGMAGMYRHLCRAWGNPNHGNSKWPENILKAVCERGHTAIPLKWDREVGA